jgi:hypothetical protein
LGKLWGSLGEALWKQVHFGGSYYTNDRVFLEGQGEDFETTKTFYNIKRELSTEKGGLSGSRPNLR